tara:strand:+ start:381 stop:665 length:285 start_codon:yes stop_codon:yes gene_type:complete
MIEIRTISEYKNFLLGLPTAKLDNFMTNFIFSFNQIGVGCNCRRKMRIRAAEERRFQSISNMSKVSEDAIQEKHENIKIVFYYKNKLIKTIGNE